MRATEELRQLLQNQQDARRKCVTHFFGSPMGRVKADIVVPASEGLAKEVDFALTKAFVYDDFNTVKKSIRLLTKDKKHNPSPKALEGIELLREWADLCGVKLK